MTRTGRTVRAGAALLLLAVAAACGGTPGEQPPTEQPTVEETAPAPSPEPGPDGSTATTDEAIRAAVEDLAERLDVDPAAIDVVSHEEVTWPDGSIGCPEPGQMYTQALVEGFRLVLAADGAEHHFHSGPDHALTWCEDPAEPVGGGADA